MKTSPTLRQKSSVALRNEARADRKLLTAEAPEKNQVAIIEGPSPVSVPKKKEKDSYAAILARLKKELARPQFTKSVREKATKKQIALWSAG